MYSVFSTHYFLFQIHYFVFSLQYSNITNSRQKYVCVRMHTYTQTSITELKLHTSECLIRLHNLRRNLSEIILYLYLKISTPEVKSMSMNKIMWVFTQNFTNCRKQKICCVNNRLIKLSTFITRKIMSL